jgi:hypothetical protein
MIKNHCKHFRTRVLSAGFGSILSMLVTFIGLLPQPVAAYSGLNAVPLQLLQGRHGHSATALPNGKILIVGGENSSGAAIKQYGTR